MTWEEFEALTDAVFGAGLTRTKGRGAIAVEQPNGRGTSHRAGRRADQYLPCRQ